MSTGIRRLLPAWVVFLAACGLVPNNPAPADRPQIAGECAPPLAFEGETTIAGLGLVDAIPEIPADDAMREGRIQVTRDPVPWEEFAPPNVPPAVAAGQLLCMTWDDGTGMTTILHRPFVGQVADPAGEPATGGPPAAPLFFAAAILVIAGASWLAFRRGTHSRVKRRHVIGEDRRLRR